MEVKGSYTYDVPIDAVIAMLRDKDATVAMYESMQHRDVQVLESAGDDSSFRIRTSQVVEANVPGFAKKVIKPANTTIQADEWQRAGDGSWQGSFETEVKGAPLRLSGTMRLVPAGEGCTHEVAITVEVKVPLIGGKIADWAGKNEVRRSIDDQFAFNARWLAEHPAN